MAILVHETAQDQPPRTPSLLSLPFLKARILETGVDQEPEEYDAAIWPVPAKLGRGNRQWSLGITPLDHPADTLHILSHLKDGEAATHDGVDLEILSLEAPNRTHEQKRAEQILRAPRSVHVIPQPSILRDGEGRQKGLLLVLPTEK